MKKDLKEAILGIEVIQFDGQKADLEELVNPKQLEKIISDWIPEVLSQEWIDSNSINASSDGVTEEYVHVDDLENLIIPKQELPVIPKYMAEYLDFAKSDVSLMRVLEIANRRDELPKWEKEYDWISANDEAFARAWLDGYEIEKEKLCCGGAGMKPKELLKLIYETKGYYTGIIDAMVDFEGINLVLSKSELEKLASRLIEVGVHEES